jgi:hypothetical protein
VNESESKLPRYLVVDAQQYKQGFVRYLPNEIPNITHHRFTLVQQLTTGPNTYLVVEPTDE